jgi:hypothetical protein
MASATSLDQPRAALVENHNAPRTLRITACKGVRYDCPDVVAKNVGMFQAKTEDELMNIFGQFRYVVAGFRKRRFAYSA